MQLLNAVPSARQTDAGLFLIRIVLGTIFIAHGAQKLFVFGHGGFAGNLDQMGVPAAGLLAALVILAELGGGIGVLLGLLTRLSGLGIAITMAGAILLVHLQNGFFAPAGVEFPLILMAAALALVITGAGSWSVDALLSRGRAPASSAGAVEGERKVRAAA